MDKFPQPERFADIHFPQIPQMAFGDWLAPGSLNVMYSRAGVGKTGVMVELIKAMRSGLEFMGQRAFRTFEGKVLWINGDLPPPLAGVQLGALADVDCDYLDLFGQAVTPVNSKQLYDICMPYSLITFDTRSSIFPGDMIDQEQTAGLFQFLQGIAATGSMVWVLAHAGKPSDQNPQSIFGSSASEWFVDNIISLERPSMTAWNKGTNCTEEMKEAIEELKELKGLKRGQCFMVQHEKAKWQKPMDTHLCAWEGRYDDNGMSIGRKLTALKAE